MPAFEAVAGMPYWIDLTTSDPARSTYFYSQLLGWEIAEEVADSDYRIARVQGLPVAGFIRQPENAPFPDTFITYFLADDLDALIAKATELGGRVLGEPTQAQLGRMAILVDTAGSMFGLIEPRGEDAFIAAGEPGTPVWHENTVVSNYDTTVDFYRELFGWAVAGMEQDDDFRYTTALVDGAAFAGIFGAEGQFPAGVPSFWQSYLGVLKVDEAVAKVPELGGEVIREPWDSQFGRMAIIADSTGATLTLCEVDEPVEEGSESDPLLDIDLSQFK